MDNLQCKALLVGNSIFEVAPHTLHELKGPPNDVRILKDTLTHEQIGLHQPENVKVLLDANQREIITELESFFSNATCNDQLLFYYSGHGLLDIRNNLYLCARDTDPEKLVSSAIPDSQINSLIHNSACSRIIIFLDCCHSGRFKGDTGIPKNLVGEGRFIIASTRAGELAVDAKEINEPSAFTKYLVEALLSGEVDANKDGFVSLGEVYSYIYPKLKQETKQTPQMKFDDAVGDIFIGCTRVSSEERKKIVPPKVSEGRPILEVSTTQIEINDVQPDEKLPDEIIDVYNAGDGVLDWSYQCEDDWIVIEQYRSSLKLRFSPKPGVNRGRLYIRDRVSGGCKRIEINIRVHEVSKPPKLELSDEQIDFGKIIQGTDTPTATIRIFNGGGGKLNPRISSLNSRIKAELIDDLIKIKVDNSESGALEGEILIETEAGKKVIPVTAFVERGPIMNVSPEKIKFGTCIPGKQYLQTIKVSNIGSGNLKWSYERRGDWFEVQKDPESITVRINCQPGTYQGAIILKSNGGDKTIAVSAKVEEKKDPPANNNYLTGTWTSNAGYFNVSGTSPYYAYQEFNLFGIAVGEGTLNVNGSQVILQGYNILAGPVNGVFTLSAPNVLNGSITTLLGTAVASFWKQG